ncbi:MAG TPA: bacteriohopanetetrol glucosamine biosynthesis glycosyltransferase HpnI, partial [Blastocatellia bacterium]|nr:bacteriohopanetetrol glucosamine biosynthesis glycosyltransferase HpnI [Blastocatellia bacterium]
MPEWLGFHAVLVLNSADLLTYSMHQILALLILVLLTFCLSALWFYCYSIYAAHDLFSRKRDIDPEFCPPLTILKPIRGLDSFAYENLTSFCLQDYPSFQIVFGVQDTNDPAVKVVQRIIKDFPHLDISLVVDPHSIGPNLKVCNLANMERVAKHSLLLISDSDIRVTPDYLKRLVQPMSDPAVGVVTCMYRSRPIGIASSIEALGISTEFHAGVLVARLLEGMKFALGSTILMRREALDAVGGFRAVVDFLGDDFLLGYLPAEAGYRVVLSDYVVEHVLDTESFSDLIHHQTRWSRSTRASRPRGYLGLIFTHGTATSLLLLIATQGAGWGWALLAAVWGARLTMAWVVGSRYLKDDVAK